MNRARKTSSSCGCFRSAFCLLKPSTSSDASGDNGDSDKKLLEIQMSNDKEEEDGQQSNGHISRPIKVPPLDLNGVQKNANFKTRGVRRRTSEGAHGDRRHLAEVVC